MGLIQWQSLQNIAAHWNTSIVRLTADSCSFLIACSSVMQYRSLWEQDDGQPVTDSQWDDIEALTAKAYTELMTDVGIGTIFPSVLATTPTGALPCDGTTYLRTDYPALYSVLDTPFIVDADHFITPDLRGRTIIGVGVGAGLSPYAPNDQGGEEAHTLITAEIPAHSHTVIDPTHSHGEGNAAAAIGAAITGVPVPSAIPSLGTTLPSGTGITLANTGGDGPHENRQPYTALRYCIWAI